MIEHGISLASNGVVKVPGYEPLLRFGYAKNRSVYRIAVTASGEWEGLAIRCFWHVPDGKDPPSSLVVDGYVDVPASVTAQSGNGCITFEGSDGTKTVTSADLRYRVSANSGTEDGAEPEPGTPAWQQLVDAVHTDAATAEQAKTDAQTAAQQADTSAGEASASAKNAGQSATEALAWAGAAEKSALAAGSNSQNAAQYAGEANSFAKQAADSSSAAESSASAAAGSQQAAESSAKKSDASANTAQESATLATGSASKAAQAQKNAETAADRAETAQQKTEEVRTDALDKISAAKTDALKAVDAKQADATAAVERTQKKALDAVTAAQGTAVKSVSDAQSTATQAVQTAQTDAVSAVEKAGSKVLESIPEDYQTTVEKVEELKTEKAEIDDTTVGPDAWSSKHIVDMLCPPLEETGNPVQCYPVSGYPLGCKVSWEPTQEGSGDPSPDNVRPIKGRDSVAVERCGENLVKFPYSTSAANRNGLVITSQQDGSITVNGTATANTWHAINQHIEKRLPVNTPLTLSGCPAGGSTKSYYIGLYLGGKWYADTGNGNTDIKFTTTEIVSRVEATITKGTVCNNLTFYPKIEAGTTITPYSKYHGQTATLTLPHTIYGGTVDAVTGDGQETWVLLTLDGTEKWRDNGTVPSRKEQQWAVYNILEPYSGTFGISSHFDNIKGSQVYPFNYVRIANTSIVFHVASDGPFATIDALKSYLAAQYAAGTPVQIAYKLATPTPFTATGAQSIPALSSVNTVLTDADSATVTGRADPIKRIIDLEDAVASMTTT